MALIPSPLRRGGIVELDTSNPDWRGAERRGGIVELDTSAPDWRVALRRGGIVEINPTPPTRSRGFYVGIPIG